MKPNPSLYGADNLECDLYAAGWRRSPNNIYSLPSVHWQDDDPLCGASPIWYAGSPTLAEPPWPLTVQVCYDRIRVFRPVLFGTGGSRHCYWDTITVAVFDNAPHFLAYCAQSRQAA